MNQTDLQGETERALRALDERITNYLASGGLFNPELMEHDKVRQLLLDCRELLPLFNAGIAGAYAAAANEAGFRVRFLITGTPDEQAAHMESCILALTPADARQAQEQHDTEIVQATHGIWMQQLGVPDSSGIPEDIGTIARAAIASAEARARLQIDYLLHRIEVLSCSGCMDGESKHPHWGQVWHGRPEPFTGEWIPTRRCISQRESAAEAAAARTPDSTPRSNCT